MEAADWKALQVLAAVRRKGGFAAAARALGVTRAAVSRSIAQLEARLGTRLARRTTRRVVLTEEAVALVDRCEPAVAAVDAALDAAREPADRGALRGRVRLAGSSAFGRDVLVPIVLAFRAEHPDVHVELSLGEALEDLVERPIDVTVRLGALPETSLVARRVGTLPLVVAARRSLVLRHGEPREPADLARLPRVGYRVPGSGALLPWPFTIGGRQHLIAPEGCVLESDSVDAVAAMVRAGAGVALVPRHVIAHDLDAGRLVELLPGRVGAGPQVHVCYAARALMPRRVRALVDALLRDLPAHCGRSATSA